MDEYAQDDVELRNKLRDIKVVTMPDQKISNVVYHNDLLERECNVLQTEVKRLR